MIKLSTYYPIYIFALWICYAIYEGIREAYYYHLKIKTNELKEYNEHPLFTYQRTIVVFLILAPMILMYQLFDVFVYAIALASVFPFIHDGFYYRTRNKLDSRIYPKGIFDQSLHSTAFSTKYFTPKVRISFAIFGVITLILFTIFNK